jgi:alpha-mannosidase
MAKKILHLICNAHLDPVWLWEWEEGAAEALSTFRTAARLCEKFEGFVFNHNEALLYQWVEQYDPALFAKIKKLVKKRKWHIMGGWYVQPDCNMPSGESFVRQILVGKRYFREKFGVEPKTAINFDSFGHTRGLVQILKKAGYSSYMFCRPDPDWLSLQDEDFIWVGYDGSEILTHRASEHYNSQKGKAAQRIKKWLRENSDKDNGILLWGIGNHGGGASREDLERIAALMASDTGWDIRHGIPEDYYAGLKSKAAKLPRRFRDINPWAVGCYTSMARVKHKHRALENSYFLTEKMVTHAALLGKIVYPRDQLRRVLDDLLFCQFHDILPGSSTPRVEDFAQQRMDHGLEILSRLRTKVFFALLSGQPKAKQEEYPIFIYNPHPFPIQQILVCEFQPHEPHFDQKYVWIPEVKDAQGRRVSCQMEKESSTLSVEWRKRAVFWADLQPGQMSRFVCRLKNKKPKPEPARAEKSLLVLRSNRAEIAIRASTGLVEYYRIKGVDFLRPRAFQALVMEDYPDPWAMKVRSFRNYDGRFSLMSEQDCAWFAGVTVPRLKPVRIIEDGPVRTVVEALFKYNHSFLCQRYKIPKKGSEFEVELRVQWNEKDRMLKVAVPAKFRDGICRGQVACGTEEFQKTDDELVAQKWMGVFSSNDRYALTVINDRTYGFDFKNGEIRLSLLRSAAYAADTGESLALRVQDRFLPRLDQGERIFRFWINGGEAAERLAGVDREALAKNETPIALCCFPSGQGKRVLPSLVLEDDAIQTSAVKMAEARNWLIIRFFEPTGKKRKTRVRIPCLHLAFDLCFDPFEIKSIAVNRDTKDYFEVDLMEEKIKKQGLLFQTEKNKDK